MAGFPGIPMRTGQGLGVVDNSDQRRQGSSSFRFIAALPPAELHALFTSLAQSGNERIARALAEMQLSAKQREETAASIELGARKRRATEYNIHKVLIPRIDARLARINAMHAEEGKQLARLCKLNRELGISNAENRVQLDALLAGIAEQCQQSHALQAEGAELGRQARVVLAEGAELGRQAHVVLADGAEVGEQAHVVLADGAELEKRARVVLAEGAELGRQARVVLAEGAELEKQAKAVLADGAELGRQANVVLADGAELGRQANTVFVEAAVQAQRANEVLAEAAVQERQVEALFEAQGKVRNSVKKYAATLDEIEAIIRKLEEETQASIRDADELIPQNRNANISSGYYWPRAALVGGLCAAFAFSCSYPIIGFAILCSTLALIIFRGCS